MNDVGTPAGRTEPGASTMPAALAGAAGVLGGGLRGTETPLSSNFTFSLPLVGLPGRGADVGLALTYNSRLWHRSTDSNSATQLTYDVDGGWPAPGFRIGYGYIDFQGSGRGFTMVEPDGTRRHLAHVTGQFYEATDGSFIRYVGDEWWGEMRRPDGTLIYYDNADNSARLYPAEIYTRNGNYLLIDYVNWTGPQITSIQDTLGRYLSFHYDTNGDMVAITRPGYDQEPDHQVVRFYYEDISLSTSFQVGTRAPSTARVLRYVYFPGRNAGYSFSYSAYGMIYRLRHTRSMGITYTGLDSTGSVSYEGDLLASTEYNYPTTASNLADAPAFTRRTDDWHLRTTGMPGTGDAPYHTFAVNQSQGTSTITAPDGTVTETSTVVNPGQWNDGLVTEVAVKQGTTVLSQVNTTWEHDGNSRNHRPQQVSVTDDASQTRSTVYSYTSYNNVSAVSERGFNSTELRRTEITYETGSNWINKRLLRLPTSVRVFTGGSNTPTARTDYVYDTVGTNLTARNDVIMHDPEYDPYGQYYYSSSDYRGNVTSVTRYADAANATGATTDTYTYDIAGNLLTATSDCCQQRATTYTKTYEYAYPTAEARGNTGQLTTSATYDFNTGLVRTTTDENSNTSTNDYWPETLRHLITFNNSTYFNTYYQDGLTSSVMRRVWFDQQGGNDRVIETYHYFNGRGAVRRSFSGYTAANEWRTSDIEYDVMGRPYRTSNPYYSSGASSNVNPSGLWTTVAYDALGRSISTTSPDGNVAQASYAGNVTTLTDQAGRQRRRISDALGRLERLDEPDGNGSLGTVSSPAQATSYTYNALNNLVRITQGAQNRYFKYDSMGRLTHERQPEQSAPHYASDTLTGNDYWSRRVVYNGQSLVTNSFDARNIEAAFAYDGLNRVTEVTYSDGTPAVTYTYDQRTNSYDNLGRLTEVTTAASGSIPLTVQSYDYDRAGRVIAHRQQIGTTTYTMSYTYNQGSALVSQTYPSGRVIKHHYDEAGRPASITDGAQTPYTYANGFAYAPHGGVEEESFGNGATQERSYNSRLQPTQIRLSVGGTERQRYDYQYGQVNLSTGVVDTDTNTGQAGRIDGYINGTKQWEQRLGYDSIGRIVLAFDRGEKRV